MSATLEQTASDFMIISRTARACDSAKPAFNRAATTQFGRIRKVPHPQHTLTHHHHHRRRRHTHTMLPDAVPPKPGCRPSPRAPVWTPVADGRLCLCSFCVQSHTPPLPVRLFLFVASSSSPRSLPRSVPHADAHPNTHARTHTGTRRCVKVVTGTDEKRAGNVTVYVDQGRGFQAATTKGYRYDKGTTVLDECYDDLKAVRMQNTDADGWVGSVTFARDKTMPYVAGSCPTCDVPGSTSLILVDGNENTGGHARCVNGKMCDISLAPVWATTPGAHQCDTPPTLCCLPACLAVWQRVSVLVPRRVPL